MLGQWSATKPSRSEELLDADEQERITGQIRQQFDSLAPKPNRSEPDPDASLDHSSTVVSQIVSHGCFIKSLGCDLR
ncbi:hypothetical protein K1719_019331 [Acacia pycnantha]|nr:hypothetical protein K1719_019331 [Acacia pycnantha]